MKKKPAVHPLDRIHKAATGNVEALARTGVAPEPEPDPFDEWGANFVHGVFLGEGKPLDVGTNFGAHVKLPVLPLTGAPSNGGETVEATEGAGAPITKSSRWQPMMYVPGKGA